MADSLTVAELIEELQKMPQDVLVFTSRPAQCCCGECFCPRDEVGEVSSMLYVQRTQGPYGGAQVEAVVL